MLDESYTERLRLERSENWSYVVAEVPSINFDSEWNVTVVPPFGGAMVRFKVEYMGARVSVYLDTKDRLGCYGSPYWEIYPFEDDIARVDMKDTGELIDLIKQSLADQIYEIRGE